MGRIFIERSVTWFLLMILRPYILSRFDWCFIERVSDASLLVIDFDELGSFGSCRILPDVQRLSWSLFVQFSSAYLEHILHVLFWLLFNLLIRMIFLWQHVLVLACDILFVTVGIWFNLKSLLSWKVTLLLDINGIDFFDFGVTFLMRMRLELCVYRLTAWDLMRILQNHQRMCLWF